MNLNELNNFMGESTSPDQTTIEQPQELNELTIAQSLMQDAERYFGGMFLNIKPSDFTVLYTPEGEVYGQIDQDLALRLKALLKRKDQIESEIESFKNEALKFMQDNNLKEIKNSEDLAITLRKGYTSSRIDSTKLREMAPTVFSLFSKESTVSPTVVLKDANDGDNPWYK